MAGTIYYTADMFFEDSARSILDCDDRYFNMRWSTNTYKWIYPMKFMTTRCNTRLAKMKSAKALSGLIPVNSVLFCGFT